MQKFRVITLENPRSGFGKGFALGIQVGDALEPFRTMDGSGWRCPDTFRYQSGVGVGEPGLDLGSWLQPGAHQPACTLAPHQGSSKKPHQSAPGPAASTETPSRPRRRPPPQRPHRCPDCDKAFSYPSKLATHRLAHGGARPHPCPDCPKAFSYPSKLAAHRLTHSGARPHSCPHCPKAFGHRSKLAAHLWTHAPARPYPCPDCSKSFCYPSKLAAHRHTHHATDARPYPCPHCPKAFSFPSKLAAHRLCHEPPTAPSSQATARRHRCSSCGQAFGQRRLLLLHQRSHHQAESQGERE
ncbi:Zinc finger protein 575 [Myotis brandtii]|uniref:Zinc finger protein 575 n=1 Tax=Myotis brandtii TaxID=109478 RepID=S7QGI2_MYOBR|nr:Zinc finger protein 575 [Myotis brandtii]